MLLPTPQQFRAIATRYDKTAPSYQVMIDLATLTLSLAKRDAPGVG